LHYRQIKGNHHFIEENHEGHPANGDINGYTNGSGASHDVPCLLVWSAADEGGVERIRHAMEEYLSAHAEVPSTFLNDLAYTLAEKRTHMPWKSFDVVRSISELRSTLKDRRTKPLRSSQASSIRLIFTGQGAQWAQMGEELLCYPIYRQSLEDAEKHCRSLGCDWSLLGMFHFTCFEVVN
jgi:acyl transferase domain-containing protein